MIYNTPFSLLDGKGWNKKKSIGKWSQKELVAFHSQLIGIFSIAISPGPN